MRTLILAFLAATAADPGRLWVRLVDEHGAPTAARIYLHGAAGKPYRPSGSLARQIGRANETFFHASGGFQLDMPAGDATLEAVKGFEYVPVKQQVLLSPNQTTVVTLRLKRWTDLPSLGWHSGDVHMHPNHVEGGVYMTLETAGYTLRPRTFGSPIS